MKNRYSFISFQLLFIILLSVFNINAQISISGKIIDVDQNPIGNVHVEIINENDSTNIYSDITDSEGLFTINSITDVSNRNKLPDDYIVLSNYPNPFNPSTIIYFELTKPEKVEIIIYDILGRKVKTLYNNFHSSGIDQIIWDGTNNFNYPVSAGVYLCRLKTKDNFKVHKMVLLDGGSNVSFVGNTKISKPKLQGISKVNSKFHFKVKVSGDSVLTESYPNFSCSQDTTILLAVSKLYNSISIGKEGGSLETNEFKLVIPASAFNSNTELNLYAEPNLQPFGEFSVSKLYHVTGILRNYQLPLIVSLKYNGNLSGISFIALGVKDTIEMFDTNYVDIVYDLYDTDELDNWLSCKISARFNGNSNLNKNNSDAEEIIDFFLGAMTKGAEWNAFGDHFKMKGTIPDAERDRADEIVSYFEQAHMRFKNAGFNYLHTEWPMELYFLHEPEVKKYYQNKIFVHPHLKGFRDFFEARILYGNSLKEELLNRGLIDYTYLKVLFGNNEIYKKYYNTELLNLVITWAAFKFGFTNQFSNDYLQRAAKSWIKKYSNSYEELLFNYFANNYSEHKVWEICKMDSIKHYPYIIQTLSDVFGKPRTWLGKFYSHLMTFEDYSPLTDDFWINKCQEDVTIDNNFTLTELPNSYTDLSSKWYHLDITGDFDENKKLKLSTDNSNASISVIKYKNDKRDLIVQGQSSVVVPYIKKLSEDGYDLFVIVTNNEFKEPYNNITDIILKIEKSNELIMTGCEVTLLGLRGKFITERNINMFFQKDTDTSNVSFENNILIQKEKYVNGLGQKYDNYIKIQFSSNHESVTSFYAKKVEVTKQSNPDPNVDYTTIDSTTQILSATNIPIISDYVKDPLLNYQLKGENVCSQITTISLEKIVITKENSTTSSSKYSLEDGSIKCSDGSAINVYIQRE